MNPAIPYRTDVWTVGWRVRLGRLASFALLAWLVTVMPARAQDEGLQIMPNCREANLRQVVDAMGEVSGRNFLVHPRLTGKVAFLGYTPMSAEAF